MKNLLRALLLVLLGAPSVLAQRTSADVYRVKIFTVYGARIQGILYEVTDSLLFYREIDTPKGVLIPGGGAVLLSDIEKVVVRRETKRAPILQGGLVGAVTGGYLSFLSLRRNPTRSFALAGVTVVSGVAGIAGIGAIVGSLIGRSPKRVFRNQGGEAASALLGDQLRPFAYSNQMDVMYEVPLRRN